VDRLHDSAHGDGRAVQPVGSTAEFSFETPAGFGLYGGPHGVRVVNHHHGVIRVLTHELGEQNGAVAGRSAADVVAQVDQDHRVFERFDRLTHSLSRVGTGHPEFTAVLPHPLA
jgi:hypothetical protein